ncbi:MAG: SAM-dependent methyltransferase, partial [Actinomycetota bacterium]|nr:SAM-dependent methyltransferase [Actinomycetota bacterium]
MTTLPPRRATSQRLSLAQIVDTLIEGELPFRFTGYDGSSGGAPDAPVGMHLAAPRGVNYLA